MRDRGLVRSQVPGDMLAGMKFFELGKARDPSVHPSMDPSQVGLHLQALIASRHGLLCGPTPPGGCRGAVSQDCSSSCAATMSTWECMCALVARAHRAHGMVGGVNDETPLTCCDHDASAVGGGPSETKLPPTSRTRSGGRTIT